MHILPLINVKFQKEFISHEQKFDSNVEQD